MAIVRAPEDTDATNLAAALAYVARGWPVLPLDGKKPLTPRGVHDATTDPETVRRWWARWPTAGVGIATGRVSGLVVVDVDGDEGERSAEALELPPTRTVRTARGRHAYYAHPGGRVPNRARVRPGVDVRGEGGYVVAPPSPHPDGDAYAWADPDAAIAEGPAWLAEDPTPDDDPDRARIGPDPGLIRDGCGTPYGRAALDREAARVRQAPVGERNDALNAAAKPLGELVAGGELTADATRDTLLDAARSVGLPEGEARRTIRSALEAGAREPRRAPWQPAPVSEGEARRRRHTRRTLDAFADALAGADLGKGKAAASRSAILEAFHRRATELGATWFTWSTRDIALAAGVARGTVSRQLPHLRAWIVPRLPEGGQRATEATAWALRVPKRAPTGHTVNYPPRPPAGADPSPQVGSERVSRSRTRPACTAPDLDVWRWARGLGHTKRCTLALLAERESWTVRELAEVRDVYPSTVRRHLYDLEAHGLARRDGGAWSAVLPSVAERDVLAERLNVAGYGAEQRRRHERDRELWRRFLAEVRARGRRAGVVVLGRRRPRWPSEDRRTRPRYAAERVG